MSLWRQCLLRWFLENFSTVFGLTCDIFPMKEIYTMEEQKKAITLIEFIVVYNTWQASQYFIPSN